MSVETKAALDKALADHVADETNGGMIGGYVALVEYTRLDLLDEGMSAYIRFAAEGQGLTTSVGLWHYGALRMDGYLLNVSEDDD